MQVKTLLIEFLKVELKWNGTEPSKLATNNIKVGKFSTWIVKAGQKQIDVIGIPDVHS